VPILIITEAKNAHFFVCKRTGFVHQGLRDFVKMTLTRVESFCEKRDSSRVTIFLVVTQVESESPKIVTRVESSCWYESSYHCKCVLHTSKDPLLHDFRIRPCLPWRSSEIRS